MEQLRGRGERLPGFVSIEEAGKDGPDVRTGADEQQDDRQEALEIEQRRLQSDTRVRATEQLERGRLTIGSSV